MHCVFHDQRSHEKVKLSVQRVTHPCLKRCPCTEMIGNRSRISLIVEGRQPCVEKRMKNFREENKWSMIRSLLELIINFSFFPLCVCPYPSLLFPNYPWLSISCDCFSVNFSRLPLLLRWMMMRSHRSMTFRETSPFADPTTALRRAVVGSVYQCCGAKLTIRAQSLLVPSTHFPRMTIAAWCAARLMEAHGSCRFRAEHDQDACSAIQKPSLAARGRDILMPVTP